MGFAPTFSKVRKHHQFHRIDKKIGKILFFTWNWVLPTQWVLFSSCIWLKSFPVVVPYFRHPCAQRLWVSVFGFCLFLICEIYPSLWTDCPWQIYFHETHDFLLGLKEEVYSLCGRLRVDFSGSKLLPFHWVLIKRDRILIWDGSGV